MCDSRSLFPLCSQHRTPQELGDDKCQARSPRHRFILRLGAKLSLLTTMLLLMVTLKMLMLSQAQPETLLFIPAPMLPPTGILIFILSLIPPPCIPSVLVYFTRSLAEALRSSRTPRLRRLRSAPQLHRPGLEDTSPLPSDQVAPDTTAPTDQLHERPSAAERGWRPISLPPRGWRGRLKRYRIRPMLLLGELFAALLGGSFHIVAQMKRDGFVVSPLRITAGVVLTTLLAGIWDLLWAPTRNSLYAASPWMRAPTPSLEDTSPLPSDQVAPETTAPTDQIHERPSAAERGWRPVSPPPQGWRGRLKRYFRIALVELRSRFSWAAIKHRLTQGPPILLLGELSAAFLEGSILIEVQVQRDGFVVSPLRTTAGPRRTTAGIVLATLLAGIWDLLWAPTRNSMYAANPWMRAPTPSVKDKLLFLVITSLMSGVWVWETIYTWIAGSSGPTSQIRGQVATLVQVGVVAALLIKSTSGASRGRHDGLGAELSGLEAP